MSVVSPPSSPQAYRSDRPRVVSAMSFASTHSHKSSRSREEKKLELTESSKEKRRLEGKADPTKALSEAEPAAVALDDSNLEDLRGLQHRDREGNIITDPDRSNPTRPRMERPLDTIRAFNDAAEGTTSRRSSYGRQTSHSAGGWDAQSRRSSYYNPHSGRGGPRPGFNGGYYRNSAYGARPDTFPEEGGPVQQPPPQRPQYQGRYQTAPYGYPQESPNSMHSNQYSYDAMTSGSDEMSKSTNPSSQNSSFDQLHQMSQRKMDGDQGTNPYRQNAGTRNPFPPSAFPNGYATSRPAPPPEDYGLEFAPSAPIPPPKELNNDQYQPNYAEMNGARLQKLNSNTRPEPQKRQSWIKRTFSKRA